MVQTTPGTELIVTQLLEAKGGNSKITQKLQLNRNCQHLTRVLNSLKCNPWPCSETELPPASQILMPRGQRRKEKW